MEKKSKYNTRQRELILEYLASLDGAHVTPADITRHFQEINERIGTTTIYRHLDKLVQSGQVQKYLTDGRASACYQYTGRNRNVQPAHFHLKCTGCGKLLHMQCDFIEKLQSHITSEHQFEIHPLKTTFYGTCQNCRTKKS